MKKLLNGEIVEMDSDEASALQAIWDTPQTDLLLPITRRQLRLTLLDHGLLDQVEPAIATLPEPSRSEAMIEWQDASEYKRAHPLMAQIGAALSLTSEQIDVMWRAAMVR